MRHRYKHSYDQQYGCLAQLMAVPILLIFVTSIFTFPVESLNGFVWRVVLCTAAIIAVLIYLVAKQSGEKNGDESAILAQLESLPGFVPEEHFSSPHDGLTLALDFSHRKICFVAPSEEATVLGFSELLSARLLVQGVAVRKYDTGSVVAGGLVGGAIAGRTGTMLGVMSAKRYTERRVRSVILKITTTLKEIPVVDLIIYNVPAKHETRSNAAEFAVALGERWEARLRAAIKAPC